MTDIDHRKVYSKGYFDGLAAAAKQDPVMTPRKFLAVEGGLTQAARKVYAACPAHESWAAIRIHQELLRIGEGGGRDVRVTMGCLQSLKESGLLNEPRRGEFIRVDVRHTQKADPEPLTVSVQQPKVIPMPVTMNPPPKAPHKPSPMELLAALASRSKELGKMAASLEADIEHAAITIEDYIANEAANSAKLKQLQELLKNLAG